MLLRTIRSRLIAGFGTSIGLLVAAGLLTGVTVPRPQVDNVMVFTSPLSLLAFTTAEELRSREEQANDVMGIDIRRLCRDGPGQPRQRNPLVPVPTSRAAP